VRPVSRPLAIVLALSAAATAACSATPPAAPGWTYGPDARPPVAAASPSESVGPATVTVGFTAEVHSSPTCSCCHQWVGYLAAAGATTTTVSEADISAYKRSLGIPDALWSCHTALIEGYVVEGHVPLAAIQRLLDERPALAGIALAGMPAGSPGMPGPKAAPFEVMAFGADGVSLFGEF
jgi:hypothetical protein